MDRVLNKADGENDGLFCGHCGSFCHHFDRAIGVWFTPPVLQLIPQLQANHRSLPSLVNLALVLS